MSIYLSKRYVIVDPEHPHSGETGTVTSIEPEGYYGLCLRLDDCRHGVDRCFARPSQLRQERPR